MESVQDVRLQGVRESADGVDTAVDRPAWSPPGGSRVLAPGDRGQARVVHRGILVGQVLVRVIGLLLAGVDPSGPP